MLSWESGPDSQESIGILPFLSPTSNYRYCKPLVVAALEGLQERFKDMMAEPYGVRTRDVKRLVFCESTCRRHKSKNRSISSLFFGPRLQQLQSSKDLRIPLRQRPSWPTRPISKVAIRSTPIMHFFYEVKLI